MQIQVTTSPPSSVPQPTRESQAEQIPQERSRWLSCNICPQVADLFHDSCCCCCDGRLIESFHHVASPEGPSAALRQIVKVCPPPHPHCWRAPYDKIKSHRFLDAFPPSVVAKRRWTSFKREHPVSMGQCLSYGVDKVRDFAFKLKKSGGGV